MATDRKYGKIEIPGIPEDEPVFIIRAKDKISLEVIEAYSFHAALESCPEEFVKSIDAVGLEFEQWQAEHEELVKLPD